MYAVLVKDAYSGVLATPPLSVSWYATRKAAQEQLSRISPTLRHGQCAVIRKGW